MSDIEPYLWVLVALALVIAALCYYRHLRTRRLMMVFRALAEIENQPMLIYDERGRLIFQSAGLVVFDPQALAPFRQRPEAPMRGQEVQGELIIDGNRYRYRTRECEYRPGTAVTVLQLSYQGAEPYKE